MQVIKIKSRKMNQHIGFLKEGIKNMKTVGSIARSSKFLCKAMIKHINFEKARTIVEFGAGDGVITKHLLEAMHPDCRLVCFEVNPSFCKILREIDDERLILIEDSAERVEYYLETHQLDKADYVVSAIPFVALPDELAYRIVDAAKGALAKGGLFIQFHYSLLLKKMYLRIFGNVDTHWAPINFPPAFVVVSEKA